MEAELDPLETYVVLNDFIPDPTMEYT